MLRQHNNVKIARKQVIKARRNDKTVTYETADATHKERRTATEKTAIERSVEKLLVVGARAWEHTRTD